MDGSNLQIMPGAGPFYFKGSEIGIMMIHGGGGGTCADLKPIAEDLHEDCGHTFSLPLLPGYGTSPEDLKNTSISSMRQAVNNELDELRERCEKIIVGGHSMGGLITLLVAANKKIDGIFTVGAPIGIQRFGFKLVPFIKVFMKYHSINSEQLKTDTNGKWIGYDKIPLNIAIKIKKLIKETLNSLPKINCPTLLLQGRFDSEIKKNSMDHIFYNINSQIKRKIWLEHNDHSILDSPDHKQIVSEILRFINELCT